MSSATSRTSSRRWPAEVGGAAKAIASIVAASTHGRLEAAYPDTPVYRFIPNIPVEVGRGVLCYAPGTLRRRGPEDELLELFGRAGAGDRRSTSPIEPAMAIMSCGPAFMALVVEALADAGRRATASTADQATRLVVETMAGTAAYLDANGLDAAGPARAAWPRPAG